MAELLEVDNLRRWFGGGAGLLARATGRVRPALRAVDGVSFTVGPGRTMGLVGESGCGKSTVARCVAGLQPATSGTVRVAGQDVGRIAPGVYGRQARRRTQMIFQDPFASLNPRWRVGRALSDPLRAFEPGLDHSAVRARVAELLTGVGLAAGDARRYPHEFSGGQRQRIAIARTLATAPELIVADEPTSALDVSVQAQILNLLRDIQRERQVAFLFISHNLAVVEHMADEVGVMYLGRIVEKRTAAALFAAPAHPYTLLLVDTVPSTRRIGLRRTPAGGEVPDPMRPPPGCTFHPRCRFADDRCRTEPPALLPVPGGVVACHAVEEGRLVPGAN